jgi:hypothetical protein
MSIDGFISRWSASGDAERANKDSFLNELCDVLGVERPQPKTGDPERDLYVFEKDVARTRAGGTSIGRVDLYKHGSFLLEAKQGAATGPKRRDSPASFDGTGVYRAFPDGHRKRFFLRDLAAHVDLLHTIWTDPHSLDPSKRAAAVTRDIALQIANLAKSVVSGGLVACAP